MTGHPKAEGLQLVPVWFWLTVCVPPCIRLNVDK